MRNKEAGDYGRAYDVGDQNGVTANPLVFQIVEGGSSTYYNINASASPSAGGTVSGGGSFSYGSTCTLTATPATGYGFVRWTKNGTQVSTDPTYSFTVTESANYVALFGIISYPITASANPTAGGSVSGSDYYNYGSSCTLTATPATGYTFVNWTENGSQVSTNPSYTFTVTGSRTLVANFTYNGGDTAPTGAINGKFTINSNSDKVYFSKGNLQYQASTNTWRFATNQYDYVGLDNRNISQTYSGWIDLFGWGTSGYNHGAVCYQPWSTSTNYAEYYAYGQNTYNLYNQTGQADWGYNAISNGGNQTGQWRTLTGGSGGEWNYIFNIRNASTVNGVANARYAKAKVNSVQGVILFPDSYAHPSGVAQPVGINETGNTGWNGNNYSASDFASMQDAGAIFLPASGTRGGTSVGYFGSRGVYWSASYYGSSDAGSVSFYDTNLYTDDCDLRGYGRSVRLVRPAENYSYEINATPNPAEGGTVSGAGTYQSGSSCTLTATPATGYSFVRWTKNGNQVSTNPTYTFMVTENASYVAVFTQNSYSISASASPSSGGTVSGGGSYNYGSTCNLVATPAAGYSFVRWTKNGSQVSTNASYTFTVTENATYVAEFSLNSYTVSASASPSAGGTVSGSGGYNHGSSCTLTATANSGYTFSNWTENGAIVSTAAVYTFEVTGNRTLVANFTYNGGGTAPTGAINGKFTINVNGDKVYFSQGNLQYIGSASTPYWKFADNQWECLGTTTGQNSTSQNVDRDLFGWGTSGWNNGNTYYHPWDSDYSDETLYGPPGRYNLTGTYANADWGVYNAIYNGGNQAGQWRTPTRPEWDYVFNTRSTTSGIRYAKAQVNNVNGVILLPDNWSASTYSLSNTNQSDASFSSNVISASQWSTLQEAGAVFLPAAGYRSGTSVYSVGSSGLYWSASYLNSGYAYYVFFSGTNLFMYYNNYRSGGRSVRLVCPAENYSYEINATPNPAEGGAVSGGGTYEEGATCTLTATANAGYAFTNWTEDGNQVSTDATYSFTVTNNRTLVANFTSTSLLSSLSDDFNDGEINPALWTYRGSSVYEADGLMKIEQNVTDADVRLTTLPMSLTASGQIVMERSFMVHRTCDYFSGGFAINFNGVEDEASNIRVAYWYENYANKHGTYVDASIDGQVTETYLCDAVFDTWLTEKVIVDTETGTLTYFLNNELVTTATIAGLTSLDVSYYTIKFWPYGWWTGHYHYMDYININTENSHIVSVAANPSDGGTVTGGGSYQDGQTCTVTATANGGYTFTNWTENGAIVSTAAVYTFEVTGSRTLVANFADASGTGILSGVFSVGEHTHINFSKGNLQYQASTDTWRFAENQYDCIGSDNSNISQTYSGWIDLFGWGTSGYNHGAICYQPWSTSQTNSDYYAYGQSTYNLYDQTGQADWGYNAIYNGGNQAGQWRTPTQPEWDYVFNTRSTTSGIRYAKAQVNNVKGVILLPDNWSTSTYSLSNTNTAGASFSSNVISASQWATLENAGAVFLPAAGYRNGTSVYNVGSYGLYWSASYSYSSSACYVLFSDANLYASNYNSRNYGRSVRLVCPAENYSYEINATPNPAEGGAVSGGGTYEEGATCTLTATANAGYSFVRWTKNSSQVSTNASYTFTVTENASYVAVFSLNSYTVSASANPTAGGTVSGGGTYDYGSTCTLTATPATGYSFVRWTKNGSQVSTNPTYTFTVTESASYVAVFSLNSYTVSASANPTAGGTVSGSGTYDYGSNCTLTATPAAGYSFVRWTKNGSQVSTNATYSFTVTENATYVANFSLNGFHFITAGTWSTASNWQNGAVPGANDEVFIDAPCQLDQDATVFALTVSDGQSLTLQSGKTLIVTNTLTNPSTSGLVIEDGAQLEHASNNVSATVKKYIAGYRTGNDKFRLISNPLTSAINPELESIYHLTRGNYDLYDWLATAPDCLEWRNFKDDSFLMYADGCGYLYAHRTNTYIEFPGTLLPSKYRFVKFVSYDANDTEHPGWNLIGNPFVCNAYLVNENNEPLPYYKMNAAGDGFEFVTSGAAIVPMEGVFYQASENGTVYFIRTDNTSQIPTSWTISVSASPSEGGTVSGDGTYQPGQICTVTATANEGYSFAHWTENGSVVSSNANYIFIVNANRTLVANFTTNGGGTTPTGAINGKFTINSSGDKVYFSQGNLQYQASTQTWRFATNQYDCIGSDNSNISQTYSGWIDLFGWGTSGWNNGNTYYHPWDSDYSDGTLYGPPGLYNLTDTYANADWGVYNAISNSGGQAGQWRTPTQPEWDYVFNTRSTTSGIRYAKAQVNNVNGVILLPDNWSASTYSLSNTNQSDASFSSNVISASQWSTLQEAGAVFLPAAGYRRGTSVGGVGSYGYYWSASYRNSSRAYDVGFSGTDLSTDGSDDRGYGQSVRLFCPAEN